MPIWGAIGPSATAVAPPAPGDTVVTFTFDGNFRSQVVFSRILSNHGLAGTFYVNPGYLDYPASLSVDELRAIARNRNEIAGASIFGNDLAEVPVEEVVDEICDDRAALAQLGFQVTSFAYPQGTKNQTVTTAAQECGYNSARDDAGLYEDEVTCSSCPAGETIPPMNDFRIRTHPQVTDITLLKRQVNRAEQSGGGWVPLVFTGSCRCPTTSDVISRQDFRAFVEWVIEQPDMIVKTVDQVIGGPLVAVREEPLEPLVLEPPPTIGASEPPATSGASEPLSKAPAWTLLGLGIGQAQLIFTGVLVSIAIVVTYRVATRRHRYAE